MSKDAPRHRLRPPAHLQALSLVGLVLTAYAVAARLPAGSFAQTAVYEALGFAMVLAYARAPVAEHWPASPAVGHGRSLRLAGLLAAALLPAWLLARSLCLHAWTLTPGCTGDMRQLAGLLWQHAVAIALPEECFWRGYVLPVLAKRWPARSSVAGAPFGAVHLATSALFALSHVVGGGPWLRLATLFPGLAFAWLASRSGSVAGPWLLHFACNGASLWAERCLPVFPS